MNVNKKIKAFAVMLALLVCMCTVLPYGVLGTPAAAAGTRPTLIPGPACPIMNLQTRKGGIQNEQIQKLY